MRRAVRNSLVWLVATGAVACTEKTPEQKLVDSLMSAATAGDKSQADQDYDLDVRSQFDVLAVVQKQGPASQGVLQQYLPQIGTAATQQKAADDASSELLGGAVGDDLRAGGCSYKDGASPMTAQAFALPVVKHGMTIELKNAIITLNNLVGGMEIGVLSCAGHEYPMALVKRRDDGAPWKVMRIGLPPQ
jgi:hypothetical protein